VRERLSQALLSRAAGAEVVDRTRVLCVECGVEHPATLEREGDRVVGRVRCPTLERVVPLSSDAETFFHLRKKSRSLRLPDEDRNRPPLMNLVSITDHCDYHCPVCYAGSGPRENPIYLPADEVLRRVRQVRRRGSKTVSLSGGEPTLHPGLMEIVRGARAAGLRIQLATNGSRLAREPDLARRLRSAGLWKVSLQLDSLNETTHLRQRGNTFVSEKITAADRVIEAGLRLGTVTTVTTLNLGELGEIVAFGLSRAPRLSTIVFQAAAPVGRYELGESTLVDKEQILGKLQGDPSLPDVSLQDVWPLPHFEPWGMRLHPDCGVNIIGTLRRGHFVPLRRLLDIEELHRRMHSEKRRRAWWARNLAPLRHVTAAARPGCRLELLRSLGGFLSGRGERGIVVIGIGEFCRRGFIDMARIDGCASAELTGSGPLSPCLLYSGVSGSAAGARADETSREE
jgi:hypothetical protein